MAIDLIIFKEFSDKYGGIFKTKNKNLFLNDKKEILVQLEYRNVSFQISYFTFRSHSEDGNQYNELEVSSKSISKYLLSFRISHSIFKRLLRLPRQKKFIYKTNNKSIFIKISSMKFFIDFFKKYSFVKLEISKDNLTLNMSCLDEITIEFLTECCDFLYESTKVIHTPSGVSLD